MNDQTHKSLINLSQDIPSSILERIIELSEEYSEISPEIFLRKVQQEIGYGGIYQSLLKIIQEENTVSVNDLMLIMKTVYLLKKNTQEPATLVWTGPTSQLIPLRKTEQVLLDLIHEAKQTIFITSFAFYRISDLLNKLQEAVDRGVKVSFLLETPQSSHFKVVLDPIQSIPAKLREKVDIYIWPYERRKQFSHSDDTGSLHAKFAIQDETVLFISSANLTESAFERNMELGVLVRDKKVVSNFQRHIEELILNNEIVRL